MRYMKLPEIARLSRRFDVFDTSVGYDPELLAAGLFPPLAVSGGDLVWGFRILKSGSEAGLEEFPAVEIDGPGKLLSALKLENRAGGYSAKEQRTIYSLALELGEDEDPDLISLAVSGNRGFFTRMKRYERLPGYLTEGIDGGRLDIGTAEKITGLPQSVCKRVVAGHGLSFSHVRRFLVYLDEIRNRDDMREESLLKLVEELLSAGDPVAEICKIRNPGLANFTRKFEGVRDRYTRNTGIRLEAPDNFEGDGFTVSFSFSTKNELKRKIGTLEKLGEGCEELEELL